MSIDDSNDNNVGLPDFAEIHDFKSIKKHFQDEKYYILRYENTRKGVNCKIYINGIEANNINDESPMSQTKAAEQVIADYNLPIERVNSNGNKKIPNELLRQILNELENLQ